MIYKLESKLKNGLSFAFYAKVKDVFDLEKLLFDTEIANFISISYSEDGITAEEKRNGRICNWKISKVDDDVRLSFFPENTLVDEEEVLS